MTVRVPDPNGADPFSEPWTFDMEWRPVDGKPPWPPQTLQIWVIRRDGDPKHVVRVAFAKCLPDSNRIVRTTIAWAAKQAATELWGPKVAKAADEGDAA